MAFFLCGIPSQLSLFFDMLLCLAKDVTKEEFVSGEKGKPYDMANNKKEFEQGIVRNARAQMWDQLRGLPMKASECCVSDSLKLGKFSATWLSVLGF